MRNLDELSQRRCANIPLTEDSRRDMRLTQEARWQTKVHNNRVVVGDDRTAIQRE